VTVALPTIMKVTMAANEWRRRWLTVAHSGCDSCFMHKGRIRRIELDGILKFIKGNFVFFLYVIGYQFKCVGCRKNQLFTIDKNTSPKNYDT